MTKYYFCKECGLRYKYQTLEGLLIHHPILRNHPELIDEIELDENKEKASNKKKVE